MREFRHWTVDMRYWIILIFISLAFWGCSKKDYTKEPAKMHWDRDMCERCKMAISERKFAVQAVDEQGRVYKFDDIGCYFLWHKLEHPEIKIKKIWITDAKTGKWIDAKKAKYVQNYITPMGYGFGALTPQEAPKDALSFDEVRKAVEKIGR
ncbi:MULTISPECIES: nitrous oxide reductase accessory protein NosL [unclassified Nitratiruptor]|uniref:nitrous oxide reductase accessory protein NosL n=1 Tax=unclassified Nitratiruptor TaxID=2624044 RepID=UPI00191688CB|nr:MULTISPECIES: nitrous oxide reductase accessory protein NosL [unclassified Nitratiruptor]